MSCIYLYFHLVLITIIGFNSHVPVPKTNTSHMLRIFLFPFTVIVSETPVALESHKNPFHVPRRMIFWLDPHFLYGSWFDPTMIVKFRMWLLSGKNNTSILNHLLHSLVLVHT